MLRRTARVVNQRTCAVLNQPAQARQEPKHHSPDGWTTPTLRRFSELPSEITAHPNCIEQGQEHGHRAGSPILVKQADRHHVLGERHGIGRLLTVSSSIADPDWRPTGAHFFNHGPWRISVPAPQVRPVFRPSPSACVNREPPSSSVARVRDPLLSLFPRPYLRGGQVVLQPAATV